MANVGRASAGPSIASSRGGSPLGIRVGGIEGGRSVRLSQADLKINNIFGPAITSPQQIGFRPQQPMGFESVRMRHPKEGPRIFGEAGITKPKVRFLGNLPNRVTERAAEFAQPKVVTRTIRFSEPAPRVAPVGTEAKPKPQIINSAEAKVLKLEPRQARTASVSLREIKVSTPVQKSPEQEQAKVLVDKYVLAHRVREVLTRLTAARARTMPSINPETSSLAITKTGTETGPMTENVLHTNVNAQPKAKFEAGIPSAAAVRGVIKREKPSNNIDGERKRRFLKVDHETNSHRLSALRAALRSLQEVNQGKDISGSDVVKESEIIAKRFRSNLLRQLGLENREDGSAYALARDLSENKNVTEERLDRAVKSNNAVEKSNKPVGTPATIDETQKVLTPPKAPPERIPEVLISEQVEIANDFKSTQIAGLNTILGAEASSATKEPEIIGEKVANVVDLLSHPLVLGVLFNIGDNTEAKRRKLLLAA